MLFGILKGDHLSNGGMTELVKAEMGKNDVWMMSTPLVPYILPLSICYFSFLSLEF